MGCAQSSVPNQAGQSDCCPPPVVHQLADALRCTTPGKIPGRTPESQCLVEPMPDYGTRRTVAGCIDTASYFCEPEDHQTEWQYENHFATTEYLHPTRSRRMSEVSQVRSDTATLRTQLIPRRPVHSPRRPRVVYPSTACWVSRNRNRKLAASLSAPLVLARNPLSVSERSFWLLCRPPGANEVEWRGC